MVGRRECRSARTLPSEGTRECWDTCTDNTGTDNQFILNHVLFTSPAPLVNLYVVKDINIQSSKCPYIHSQLSTLTLASPARNPTAPPVLCFTLPVHILSSPALTTPSLVPNHHHCPASCTPRHPSLPHTLWWLVVHDCRCAPIGTASARTRRMSPACSHLPPPLPTYHSPLPYSLPAPCPHLQSPLCVGCLVTCPLRQHSLLLVSHLSSLVAGHASVGGCLSAPRHSSLFGPLVAQHLLVASSFLARRLQRWLGCVVARRLPCRLSASLLLVARQLAAASTAINGIARWPGLALVAWQLQCMLGCLVVHPLPRCVSTGSALLTARCSSASPLLIAR